MGLSNVNFGVGKTGKTGLDRVKQQNSKTKGIYCSPLSAKDLWAMAGNWQESAERTQASQSCAPQDWQSAGFRSLLTLSSSRGQEGTAVPAHRLSLCQMLSEGRSHWFQNYLQLCGVFTLQPGAIKGGQREQGCGWPAVAQDCSLHRAQAFCITARYQSQQL